jgi:hypothetical protein
MEEHLVATENNGTVTESLPEIMLASEPEQQLLSQHGEFLDFFSTTSIQQHRLSKSILWDPSKCASMCEKLTLLCQHPSAKRYAVLISMLFANMGRISFDLHSGDVYRPKSFASFTPLSHLEMQRLPFQFFMARKMACADLLVRFHEGFMTLKPYHRREYIQTMLSSCTRSQVLKFVDEIRVRFGYTVQRYWYSPQYPDSVPPLNSAQASEEDTLVDDVATSIAGTCLDGAVAPQSMPHDGKLRIRTEPTRATITGRITETIVPVMADGTFTPPYLKGVGVVSTFQREGERHLLMKRDLTAKLPSGEFAVDVFGGKIETGTKVGTVADSDSIATGCREFCEETSCIPYLYLTNGWSSSKIPDIYRTDAIERNRLLASAQAYFEAFVRSKPQLIRTTPAPGVHKHFTMAFGVYIIEDMLLPESIFSGVEDEILYEGGIHYEVFSIAVSKLHTLHGQFSPRLRSINFCNKIQMLYGVHPNGESLG